VYPTKISSQLADVSLSKNMFTFTLNDLGVVGKTGVLTLMENRDVFSVKPIQKRGFHHKQTLTQIWIDHQYISILRRTLNKTIQHYIRITV